MTRATSTQGCAAATSEILGSGIALEAKDRPVEATTSYGLCASRFALGTTSPPTMSRYRPRCSTFGCGPGRGN